MMPRRRPGAHPLRSNVEIKARVPDAGSFHTRAREIAGPPVARFHQTDTFFHVPAGRLKLREIVQLSPAAAGGRSAELIHYHRPDAAGPRTSRYRLLPVPEAGAMRALLADALGERAVVRKTRTLYRAGRTRIHADQVEGLGAFMELEVVLREGESEVEGEREVERLREALGVRREDLVEGAYVDMLPPA
jgi:predicted adenylyl cyclase CyaB